MFPTDIANQKRQTGNAFQEYVAPKTPESECTISVEVVDEAFAFDGIHKKKGTRLKISAQAYRALARHVLWIDGPAEHRPSHTRLLHPEAKLAPAAN